MRKKLKIVRKIFFDIRCFQAIITLLLSSEYTFSQKLNSIEYLRVNKVSRLEITTISSLENNDTVTKTIYLLDTLGRPIKWTDYDRKMINIYKYEKKNLRTIVSYSIADSNRKDFTIFYYDKKDSILKCKNNKDVSFKKSYKYNNSGNLIFSKSITNNYNDDKIVTYQYYYYNYFEQNIEILSKVYYYEYHNNKPIKTVGFDKINKTFNKDGVLIELIMYENKNFSYKILYEYDSLNRLIEKTNINVDPLDDKKNNYIIEKYQYDENGNLITIANTTINNGQKDEFKQKIIYQKNKLIDIIYIYDSSDKLSKTIHYKYHYK